MSLRIVACDVDPDFGHALGLTARDCGHELRVASSWSDVEPLLASWKPHLVVLDASVPGIDAAEVAVTVQWMTDARVILYSTEPLSAARKADLRGKCDTVIAKDRIFWAIRKLPRVTDTRAIRRPKSERLRANVAGTFDEQAPLGEVLGGIEFNRKTGVMRFCDGYREGVLLFRDGAPVRCTWGELRGAEAVRAVLAVHSGDYVLEFQPRIGAPREIEESFSKLILEHLRRCDERRDVRGGEVVERSTAAA